jgi:hypothetical protein
VTATCTYYTADAGVCGTTPTRVYLQGRRCPDHTPARLAGRPETVPDPARTLDGIRAAHGMDTTRSYTPIGPTAIDRAAIRSGKRRSTPADYREANR